MHYVPHSTFNSYIYISQLNTYLQPDEDKPHYIIECITPGLHCITIPANFHRSFPASQWPTHTSLPEPSSPPTTHYTVNTESATSNTHISATTNTSQLSIPPPPNIPRLPDQEIDHPEEQPEEEPDHTTLMQNPTPPLCSQCRTREAQFICERCNDLLCIDCALQNTTTHENTTTWDHYTTPLILTQQEPASSSRDRPITVFNMSRPPPTENNQTRPKTLSTPSTDQPKSNTVHYRDPIFYIEKGKLITETSSTVFLSTKKRPATTIPPPPPPKRVKSFTTSRVSLRPLVIQPPRPPVTLTPPPQEPISDTTTIPPFHPQPQTIRHIPTTTIPRKTLHLPPKPPKAKLTTAQTMTTILFYNLEHEQKRRNMSNLVTSPLTTSTNSNRRRKLNSPLTTTISNTLHPHHPTVLSLNIHIQHSTTQPHQTSQISLNSLTFSNNGRTHPRNSLTT